VSQLSKLEAARRQLVSGIRLFFEDGDSVSIYTLAHASWEVLDALCRQRGKTRFYDLMAGANGMLRDPDLMDHPWTDRSETRSL
jgi:hypothetical protein